MADGFSLNVDPKFLQNLEEADKRIQKIADTMEDTSKRIIKSFQDINRKGLDVFVNKMNDVNKVISSLGNKKISISSILGGKSQTAKSVDDVNKLIELLNKLSQETKKTQGANKRGGLFGDMSKSVSDWQALQKQISDNEKQISKLTQSTREYESTMKRIQSGKGGVIHGGASKEYQENLKNIESLKQQNASLQQKQQLIIQNNQAIQAQANLQQQLKQYHQQQGSLPEQRKANELKRMNDYYRELEKSSKKAAEEATKAADKESEERKKAKRAAQEQADAETKRQQRMAQSRETQMLNAYNQAMKANEATVNQRINKLAKLRQVESQLAQDEAKYSTQLSRVRSEIDRLSQANDKAAKSTKQLQSNKRNLMDITGQLQRKLALLFSVSAIQGYMDKLVNVRKEFELQQKSLQVLLQSKDEANKLWQQTVDLAVRSPFRVKELVTYTRQLAAYRIETNKLHDTTKRLADVSAGLGVDMQRLILAFGQVRAANFLRGTELRQFTEAGIPMLDELAKHFTELEGKAISAGDVFEMISKRMVLFEDVEAVFKKMTSEGGAFFQMQEEQSKTLAGMISNLYDTIDLMLNDIGKSYDSFLKNSVNFAKWFVENWRAMAEVIKGVLLALAGYKLYQLAVRQSIIDTAVAQGILNNANTKQLTQIQLLRVGWNNLTTSMKAAGTSMKSMLAFNLPLLAVTALVSGVWKLVSAWKEHEEQLNKISKEYDELRKKAEKINVNFKIATDENNFKEQKNKLNELITLANNDYNMKIKVDVDGMDAKAIQDKFNEISSNIFEANIFAEHFAKQMQQATEWVVEDDILEDFQDLGNKANELFNQLALNRERLVFNLIKQEDKLNESQKKALDLLRKPKQSDENEAKYLQRLSDGYRLLMENFNKYAKSYRDANSERERFESQSSLIKELDNLKELGINATDISKVFGEWSSAFQEAKNEFNSFVSTLNLDENLTDEQKELRLKTAIDKEASEKGWNDFVKNYIYRWTEETFKIKFKPEIVEEDPLKAWQDTYNQLFRGMEGFREITKNTMTQKEIIDRLNASIKETEDLINRINKAGGIKATSKGGAYEGVDLSQLNNALLELKKQRDWLGGSDKNKDTGKDWTSEVVKGIKDAHQEYIKLNKTLSSAESKQMALAKYADLFKEAAQHTRFKNMNLKDIDFTTEKGTIKALEDMLNKLPKSAKQARITIQKALKEIRGEQTISFKIKEDQKILDQIEEMFSGYEMSIELEKLNIPPDLAKQLFNIDSIDLSGLKSRVEGLQSLFIGTDMEGKYKEYLQKISEMEDKEQVERLKSYTKYIVKAQSERTRITFEALEKIRKAEEMHQQGKFNETEMNNIRENINKERDKALADLAFNEFKNSDLYLKMFEDFDSVSIPVLEAMKERVENLRKSLKELGASSEDVKNLTQQLEKIDDAIQERNPFKDLFKNIKEYRKLQGERDKTESEYKEKLEENEKLTKALAEASKEVGTAKSEYNKAMEQAAENQTLKNAQSELDIAKARLAVEINANGAETQKAIALQQEVESKQQAYDITYETLVLENKSVKTAKERLDNANKAEESAKNALNKSNTDLSALLSKLKDMEELSEKIAATLQFVGQVFQELASTVTDVASSLENVFGAMDDKTSDTISSISEILGGLGNTASGVGRVMANPMDIGGYFQAISGLASTIGSIFAIGDKKKERQIQREIKFVEDLERAYERLEKAIDNAYSINTLQTSNKEAQINLKNQIAAYDRMIQAEEAKKKTDKDRIKEWKNTQDELREQMQELREEVVSTATDGILDNVLDAAQAFTDAWYEAFKETGDGLSGLEENFTEVMQNLVKRQASMLITQQWVNKWKSELTKYINPDDLTLTANEAGKWVDEIKKSLPQLSGALENYFKAMEQAGVDLMSGSLSGLQKGIQGITEQQADILAAYLNSIRFFVADNNNYLSQIAASFGNTEIENPMVSELKTQTEMIRAIRDMFSSVIRNGHPTFGGAFIKVAL